MKRIPKLMFVITLLAAFALLVGCGGGTQPAPVAEETEPEATVEEDVVAEATAEEEIEPEATTEDEAAQIQQEQEATIAEQSVGITVVTDEPDVSSPRTHRGGTYRVASSSDAVSFHPYLTNDVPSSTYQGLVYSGALLRRDEKTLDFIPNMAEQYEISDDGLTFTFYLRQDIQWSDGEPLTAQDYQWTFDQVMNPDNGFPYLSQYEFITSYQALDDYTIEATIDEIYAPALGQISAFITPLPRHIWQDLPWDDPERNREINSPSVFSGPYKLEEWKRDQFVIFEANEDYWYHGPPNIDRYTIEIVPDQDIAFQKLKTSEVDSAGMSPEQLEEARELDNLTVYEWWPVSTVWFYIGMNMREGFPTSDINVRHALSYAIDKQLITDEVWLGQAKRTCSIYHETSWVYNPDVPCYEYDPEKAIELLEIAGYTLNEAGEMVDENGEQLTLKYLYGPNTSKTSELIAVTVQDYLADIGINMEIEGLEWASFLERTAAEEPDWDLHFGGWRSTPEPQTAATIWAAENIPDLNSVAYINPEMEQLFKEAGRTYDKEVRKEKYSEIQTIISEDSPYIFLVFRKEHSAKSNRIKGIEPTALGIGWNQEDWYIEESVD